MEWKEMTVCNEGIRNIFQKVPYPVEVKCKYPKFIEPEIIHKFSLWRIVCRYNKAAVSLQYLQ